MKEKKAPKAAKKADSTPARFKVGDRVRVKDLPNMFYSRTQMYARGDSGTIAARTYQDLIPEDEAFNRDGRLEQYYIVLFRQKELWQEHPSEKGTMQTEFPERWIEPV